MKFVRCNESSAQNVILYMTITITMMYSLILISIGLYGFHIYYTTPILQDLPVVIKQGPIIFDGRKITNAKQSLSNVQAVISTNIVPSINQTTFYTLASRADIQNTTKELKIVFASLGASLASITQQLYNLSTTDTTAPSTTTTKTNSQNITFPNKIVIAPIIDALVSITTSFCSIIWSLDIVTLYITATLFFPSNAMPVLSSLQQRLQSAFSLFGVTFTRGVFY